MLTSESEKNPMFAIMVGLKKNGVLILMSSMGAEVGIVNYTQLESVLGKLNRNSSFWMNFQCVTINITSGPINAYINMDINSK